MSRHRGYAGNNTQANLAAPYPEARHALFEPFTFLPFAPVMSCCSLRILLLFSCLYAASASVAAAGSAGSNSSRSAVQSRSRHAAVVAEEPSFVEAKALNGEGTYALLRRYRLPIDGCHIGKFQELNSLSAKQPLHKERLYKLPLLRYTYNGKSIRSTIGNNDWVLAKAIQDYNRSCEQSGQQNQPYEKSGELWVPYGMLHCPADATTAPTANASTPSAATGATAATPSSSTSDARAVPAEATSAASLALDEETARIAGSYAIFGPAYAQVEKVDNSLAGQYFYLIAGHGGPDPGAMARVGGNRICEDEYAYDVLLRLARNIISHGGVPHVIVRDPDDGIRDEAYLKCDYDEVNWGDQVIPRDQLARLAQRTDVINALAKRAKARGVTTQYCIEIHVDSRHAERQTDLYFYHQKKSDESEDTAECIREAMKRNYERHGRSRAYEGTIRSRELYTLRETEIPTIYIELGNIQHSFDQQRVLRPSNRQALADWFVEGLIDRTAERAKR